MTPTDIATLLLSLKTASAATAVAFVTGLATAWFMAHAKFRGKTAVDACLLAPLVLPPTVVGFVLLLLIGSRGPIGKAAEAMLGSGILFTWPASVLAAAVVSFPLMYRTARGAFEQIDPMILAAGRTLGAGPWRIFRELGVPQAWPGIIAATVLTFARALGEFGATLMIAGNIPGRTQTIPLAIYSDVESGDIQHAGLWAAIVIVITILLAIAGSQFSKRFSRRSKASTPRQLPSVPDSQPVDFSAAKTSDRASLSFNIKKELGSFCLDVAFTSTSKSCAIVGASGAGKSVLLRCLSGLETPDSGTIVVNGRTLLDRANGVNVDADQRHVGHVFQNYALFSHLSVFGNVAFGLNRLPPAERHAKVMRMLAAIGLQDCVSKFPTEISGGQQQRVALARALVMDPDLLLLDEPLSALDSHLKHLMERLLTRAVGQFHGVTLMVTHNLEEAFRICDDLVILDEGRVIAHGPKHDVFAQPGTVRAAVLTGCKNIARLRRVGDLDRFVAENWGGIEVVLPRRFASARSSSIGIRAHQIVVDGSRSDATKEVNSFPCWLEDANESPHRMTLHLRLTATCSGQGASHLQVEMPKEEFRALERQPQPWRAVLRPERLMTLV